MVGILRAESPGVFRRGRNRGTMTNVSDSEHWPLVQCCIVLWCNKQLPSSFSIPNRSRPRSRYRSATITDQRGFSLPEKAQSVGQQSRTITTTTIAPSSKARSRTILRIASISCQLSAREDRFLQRYTAYAHTPHTIPPCCFTARENNRDRWQRKRDQGSSCGFPTGSGLPCPKFGASGETTPIA
jgi:hypothetical protein